MNVNEIDIGKKIARHLNVATNNLSEPTLDRLKAARMQALEAYSHQPVAQPVAALAGAGAFFGGNRRALLWIPTATLLLALGGLVYWQTLRSDISDDVDAQLLSDELPIHALTSQEFETWLQRSSR
jgi:Protein of unknown function (DUF3619)